MTAIWLAQAALAVLLVSRAKVALRAATRDPRWLVAIGALQVALIASAAQLENYIWAFGLNGVLTALGAAIASFAAAEAGATAGRGGRRPLALLGVAMAAALVAQLSSANGNGAWVAILLVLLWYRAPRAWLIATGAATVATVALFFVGYSRPDGFAGPAEWLTHPFDAAGYFLASLGGFGGSLGVGWARLLGALTLATYVALAAAFIQGRRREPAVTGCLAVMTYVVGATAVSAAGLFPFGPEQALAGRYAVNPLLFWAAALPVIRVAWARRSPIGAPRWAAWVAAAALALPVLPAIDAARQAPTDFEAQRAAWPRAEIALLTGANDPATVAPLWGANNFSDEEAATLIAFLREERYSVFAEPRATWPRRKLTNTFAVVRSDECLGSFDLVRKIGEPDTFQASGWGWDTGAQRPFAEIVLVDRAGTIVGLGDGGVFARRDVVAALPAITTARVGWGGYARGTVGPLTAYGVLGSWHVCRLGNDQPLTAN